MSEQRNWRRIRERLELKLPVRVRCRETPDFEWTEVTRLTDVTPFGAGFSLKRPTEKGRLVHMTIPMPRQLRVFDHLEDQYRIWALVRHVRSATAPDRIGAFEIGVAFIGKRPPASYEREPWKRYEIGTADFKSLASPEKIVKPIASLDQRTHTRHRIAIDVLLEMLDENGQLIQSESSVTEDISSKGATIFTTLEIPIGRFVRLTSAQYNLTVHAAVRNRSTGVDGIPRIHVEFIDKDWPL
ncbi:MAG TPA: PilZ domain-containing protein [Pyrinomonadaceae bacterium]